MWVQSCGRKAVNLSMTEHKATTTTTKNKTGDNYILRHLQAVRRGERKLKLAGKISTKKK